MNVKPRKENEPFYDIALIIDPLTRNAQKVSTILKALSKVANVNFMIYFNCKEKLSAPPLKRYLFLKLHCYFFIFYKIIFLNLFFFNEIYLNFRNNDY